MIPPHPDPRRFTIYHLAQVLEWAMGNRGSKHGNPYAVPEIKAALQHIATLTGNNDYLDVNLQALIKELEK